MKTIGSLLGTITVVHVRFLLSFGFLAIAVYSYLHSATHLPLRAIACALVGIGYFVFAIYSSKKRKLKTQ
ncbi:MAG TPA: hypothetical protein VN616_09465 [Puia sp.]|nr:hypothetical protein [Puia sp.]